MLLTGDLVVLHPRAPRTHVLCIDQGSHIRGLRGRGRNYHGFPHGLGVLLVLCGLCGLFPFGLLVFTSHIFVVLQDVHPEQRPQVVSYGIEQRPVGTGDAPALLMQLPCGKSIQHMSVLPLESSASERLDVLQHFRAGTEAPGPARLADLPCILPLKLRFQFGRGFF